MDTKFIIVGAALAAGACISCGSGKEAIFRESAALMGTFVEVAVVERSEPRAREAISAVMEEMRRVDGLISTHKPESLVSRLNRAAGGRSSPVESEVFTLIAEALRYSEASGGAFDITVGPLLPLWSFESGGRLPAASELAAIMPLVGYKKLEMDKSTSSVGFARQGMAIDLGAIGAGWAADRAVAKLQGLGVRSAIVDAGGEIRVLGTRPDGSPWRIGVRHPREDGLLATFKLRDTAIATSGDYERFFEEGGVRYHHILDPATGLPAPGCRSVTVLAPTATEADACSTAAFVLGPERGIAFLRSRPGVRGFVVDARGGLHWTDDGLRAEAGL